MKKSGKKGLPHFAKAQKHRAAAMGVKPKKAAAPVVTRRRAAPPMMNTPAMPASTFGNSGLGSDTDNDGM